MVAAAVAALSCGAGPAEAMSRPAEALDVGGVFGQGPCAPLQAWSRDPGRGCRGMAPAAAMSSGDEPASAVDGDRTGAAVPSAGAVGRAQDYLRGRAGVGSFAVIDTEGRLRGSHLRRRYVSASVVKAMLLVGHLRRASGRGLRSGERRLLGPMIRRSGNAQATAVHRVVRDGGLRAVARAAHMRDFSVSGTWAGARITAADQARLFHRLDRLLPARHREYARGLLSSIVPGQSWGIPAAARPRWRVYFKGGWRPTARGRLVHQAGRLEDGERVLSIAVLTDGDPSHGYGTRTVRGVTRVLLSDAADGAPGG